MVCPGLGHINRGYESFTRECFDAIRRDPRFDVFLFKGAGPPDKRERALRCLRRDTPAARWLGSCAGWDGYFAENVTFLLSLLPSLVRHQPRVVFFSDSHLGNYLWHWRRWTRGRFKLLLSNGGPLGPPDFPRFDHVHQVSAVYYDESARAGRSADTQTLLPYGFHVPPTFTPPTAEARAAARRQLGLPLDRPVVLSVGAVNRTHKRMGYLIEEIAALPPPRPFLVMLGQQEAETAEVLAAAAERLGPGGYACRTVPAGDVAVYHAACDVFALASLKEGFSRAMGEALAAGMPCVAADQGHARYVLGEHGYYGDFSRPGGLVGPLARLLADPDDLDRRRERHRAAAGRYGWDQLAPKYIDMILRCAGGGVTASRSPGPSPT